MSLANHGSQTTYEHLGLLYEALHFVKQTSGLGITLYPVPIDETTTVVAYSDASCANAQNSASQHGQLILLAPATVTEKACLGALVDWKSGRSKRACRSTLASEAVSADTAVDRLAYVQYALADIIFGIPAHRVGKRLSTILISDCKSLYDCVVSQNPNIEDKRSLVNVRSIQEFISARTMHWVPTALQRADGLTKISKELREQLLEWLQKPLIVLRSEGDESKENYSSVKVALTRMLLPG